MEQTTQQATRYAEIAQATATALGGILIDKYTDAFAIALPDDDPDAALTLRFSPWKLRNRISITPRFDARNGSSLPESCVAKSKLDAIGWTARITVAMTTRPERIAAEIRRRLLPPYVKALGLVRESLEHRDTAALAREAALRTLATAAGVPLNGVQAAQGEFFLHLDQMRARVRVSDASEAAIELNGVAPDLAERILALVANANARNTA